MPLIYLFFPPSNPLAPIQLSLPGIHLPILLYLSHILNCASGYVVHFSKPMGIMPSWHWYTPCWGPRWEEPQWTQAGDRARLVCTNSCYGYRSIKKWTVPREPIEWSISGTNSQRQYATCRSFQIFIHSLLHSFHKDLWSTYYVPGTWLGVRPTRPSKTRWLLASWHLGSSARDSRSSKVMKIHIKSEIVACSNPCNRVPPSFQIFANSL